MTARLSIRVSPPTTTFNILDYGAVCGTNESVTANAAFATAMAFASAVNGTVVVPACGGGGRFYVDPTLPGGVLIPSNVTLQLDGVIQAQTNSLIEYAVVAAYDATNVTITGTGQIIGDFLTHTGSTGEWGHCLKLGHVEGLTATTGISLSQGWGDGIYVGDEGGNGSPNTAVVFDGTTVNHCHRNNLSVINSTSGSFTNGVLSNAAAGILGAGFDFEPNSNTQIVTGWVITGNAISGNAGYAGQLVCLNGPVTLNTINTNVLVGNGHDSILNTGGCS